MASTNINRVVMTGNLTADPELRSTASGMSVCHLRLACNTRRKDGATGEWVDKPNYFNITVWGGQGENAAKYLAKGRPIAIDGRLEWREWETATGEKRQGTEIIADSVQFLGAPTNGVSQSSDIPPAVDFVPVPAGVGAGDGDPDIPF
jgi:single-strand DNA-binding protein